VQPVTYIICDFVYPHTYSTHILQCYTPTESQNWTKLEILDMFVKIFMIAEQYLTSGEYKDAQ